MGPSTLKITKLSALYKMMLQKPIANKNASLAGEYCGTGQMINPRENLAEGPSSWWD
jgi:hypothetical protein